MPRSTIPYHETGYYSKLITDYLSEAEALQQFYQRFPKITNFNAQLSEKKKQFSDASREALVEQLHKQYANTEVSEATQKNIDALANENTFTITTGHQLNLFTGPLYFLYKIFSVINLAETLNKSNTNSYMVPVFWMATEDHDFEEINYFNFKGKKIQWNRKSSGAVGMLETVGLEEVFQVIEAQFGKSENAKHLLSIFKQGYLEHTSLAEATRFIANTLFSDYGLVIIDGNDKELKKQFIPFAEKEINQQLSFSAITETTDRLNKMGYPEQVHPREINLFYLKENLRERIVQRDDLFFITETDISFTQNEILDELKANPERFSPNALLRPLYQEVILPNLCYVGGGGELAYWFQLQDYFKKVEVVFPILLLRNSVLLVPDRLSEKLDKLEVEVSDLFLKQHELTTKHTKKISDIAIDFSSQRAHLEQQFKALYELAKKTDASFVGAVAAQEKKQLNGLDKLEKRLLKAQKRKLTDELERLTTIQDQLFPKQSLQERNSNFAEFYLEYGQELFYQLKDQLDPLLHEFTLLRLPKP
ncbi:bacillithiol biosynthesis cysteine-adding enzyme BshC [Candidatus Ulvibacter alkanivorans]|uniref:bacillithiol biosynthesis cysteine-adding enzyme BshC n=1 Tax=Candidatus Ulvibacter alkanivorans TaxID=2267620 RepID=UPI000DF27FDD|nr:bacillithiol biosynthesis cysteine-adding enzyme BshC [Candidatus Ulvibacter alkanivorans]